MKTKILLALFSSALFFENGIAYADEENTDQCHQTCDSGQKLVGYGDGNNATCVCVESSSMTDTEANESVTTPSHEDELAYQDSSDTNED